MDTVRLKKGERAGGSLRVAKTYASAEERASRGRALRDIVPRASHAGWKAPKGRRDPVELLVESNAGRVESLVPIRFGRMSAVAVRVLPRLGRADGRRPCEDADERHQGPGLRRCAPDELRRLRDAGAQRDLRHQRSRRDAAGSLGMGPEAARRERRDRGAAPAASGQRCGARGDRSRARVPRADGRLRDRCARSRSGTTGSICSATRIGRAIRRS